MKTPAWLRPVAFCAFGAAHVALVVALPGAVPLAGVVSRTIELEIIAAPEESSPPETAPQRPSPDAVPLSSDPDPAPEEPRVAILALPPPPEIPAHGLPPPDRAIVPEPAEADPELPLPNPPEPVDLKPSPIENKAAIPIELPKQIPKQKQQIAPQPRKETPPLARQKRELPAPRSVDRQARPAETAAPSPLRAASSGSATASAGYSVRVRGILQARANALAIEDANGVVGIIFVIAGNGRLSSFSITRPSGNFQIDRAIRAMLGSISFPPPPGGQYSGSVTVRVR
jgi:periplasmic protein TonB